MALIEKILSGGQTGAEIAALDWAMEHDVPHGGWCPCERRAEGGVIDARYQLKEAPSGRYLQRTEWNVRDSDGTVIFSVAAALNMGLKQAVFFAHKHRKPLLCIWRDRRGTFPEEELLRFVREKGIKVLNVTGSKASREPQVYAFVKDVLTNAFVRTCS